MHQHDALPPLINGTLYVPNEDGTETLHKITDGNLPERIVLPANTPVRIRLDSVKDIPGIMGKDYSEVSVGYILGGDTDA